MGGDVADVTQGVVSLVLAVGQLGVQLRPVRESFADVIGDLWESSILIIIRLYQSLECCPFLWVLGYLHPALAIHLPKIFRS